MVTPMYMPSLVNSRVVERYKLGDLVCHVRTDCRSAGGVDYAHVMQVVEDGELRFAVAAEVNATAESFGGGSHFLGVFHHEGHQNLGSSDEWADLARFTEKALEIVAEQYKVSGPPEKVMIPELQTGRPKRWWQFWK